MKKQQILQTRDLNILAGILCLAMAVGFVWDEPISRWMYNSQSIIGGFLAAYGELPIGVCMVTAGVLFIMGRRREQAGAAYMAISAACILYGAFAMAVTPSGGLSFWVCTLSAIRPLALP